MTSPNKCLVLLWHPEPPYTGGTYNAVEQTLRIHATDETTSWFVIDKEGSNLSTLKNLLLTQYETPALIRGITGAFFVLGRALDWAYSCFVLVRLGYKRIREEKIEFVYVPIAELIHLSLAAFILKKIAKVKVIGIVHQWHPVHLRNVVEKISEYHTGNVGYFHSVSQVAFASITVPIFSYVIKSFDRVGTVSLPAARDINSNLGVADFVMPITYGGVDYSLLEGIPTQPKTYEAVFLGRLVYFKGLTDLLCVWSLVIKKKPKARLLVIGEGDPGFQKNLEEKVDSLGIRQNIVFAGKQVGKKKFELLKQSRIFLYLSHSESYGQVIDEAISSNLPVVAYNLPEYESRYEYTDFMYLFSMGDFEEISAKVVELLDEDLVALPRKKMPTWQDFAAREKNLIFDEK